MSKPAILEACRRIGGQAALARGLGLKSQGTVSNWIARGFIPAPDRPGDRNRIIETENLTRVHRHYLNSQIYPDPPPARFRLPELEVKIGALNGVAVPQELQA